MVKTPKSFSRLLGPSNQVLFAGFLIHLVLGNVYTWGNLTTYVTSYLRMYQQGVTYEQTIGVYALQISSQAIFMALGGHLETIIGPRWVCIIGMICIFCATFFASQSKSLLALLLIYGVGFGTGIGIIYVTPLSVAYRWMPHQKGLASGVVLAGFGCSALIFNQVATLYVNPENLEPSVVDGTESYFSPEDGDVLDKVPQLFCLLSYIYVGMFALGICLLRNPKDSSLEGDQLSLLLDEEALYNNDMNQNNSNNEEAVEKKKEKLKGKERRSDEEINFSKISPIDMNTSLDLEERLKELDIKPDEENMNINSNDNISTERTMRIPAILRQLSSTTEIKHPTDSENIIVGLGLDLKPSELLVEKKAWLLSFCMAFSAMIGLIVIGVYKSYGLHYKTLAEDHYLALVGSSASFGNAIGRVVWGLIGDRIGFFRTLYCIQITMCLCLLFWSFTVSSKASYLIVVTFIAFNHGGNFALYPATSAHLFGKTYCGANFGLIFCLYGLLSVAGIYSLPKINCNFLDFTFLLGSLSLVAIVGIFLLHRMYIRTKRKLKSKLIPNCKYSSVNTFATD